MNSQYIQKFNYYGLICIVGGLLATATDYLYMFLIEGYPMWYLNAFPITIWITTFFVSIPPIFIAVLVLNSVWGVKIEEEE